MKRPCLVPVESYGDGWKPLHAMCPLMRDEPGCGQNWCLNSQDTAACGDFRGIKDNGVNIRAICAYALSEEEDAQNIGELLIDIQGEPYEDLKCLCGCKKFLKSESGNHLGLYCGNCGKWQKWIQKEVHYEPNFIIPFGKHKGMKISLVPGDYMLWAVDNLNGSMRRRFELALEHRDFMFLVYLYESYVECRSLNNQVHIEYCVLRQEFCKIQHKTTPDRFDFWFERVRNQMEKYPMFEIVSIPWVLYAIIYHPEKMASDGQDHCPPTSTSVNPR